MNVYYISKNCCDISNVIEDMELKKSLQESSYIRNETLNRLRKIKNCKDWTRKIRNYYYDKIKKEVMKELQEAR